VEGDAGGPLRMAQRQVCAACKSLVLPELGACQRAECSRSARLLQFCEECLLPVARTAAVCPNADCPRPEPLQRTSRISVLCYGDE
jgi:hypothetical protein